MNKKSVKKLVTKSKDTKEVRQWLRDSLRDGVQTLPEWLKLDLFDDTVLNKAPHNRRVLINVNSSVRVGSNYQVNIP